MTIKTRFPPIEPSLDLNFAKLKRLDPRVTFTRASSGTYVGSNRLIKTADINEPRFDHNPTTGESLGLLVEEQRTNLLSYSDAFDNAAWSVARCTISANTSVSPDGLNTADTLVEDTTSNSHPVFRTNAGLTNATAYTASVYIKAGARDKARVALANSAFAASVFVDYDLVAVTATANNATGTITPVGNGWYRCTITATTIAAASGDIFIQPRNSAGSASYLGTGVNAILIWGAQLEAGAFPTSYIPTTASSATRSADVASITGNNFSSWYRQDEGTVLVRASSNKSAGSIAGAFSINASGSSNNRLDTRLPEQSLISSGGTVVANLTTGTITLTPGAQYTRATAYRVNDFAASGGGTTALTDADGAVPVGCNQLEIGNVESGQAKLNGTIRRLTYWPQRLSNAVLQALTS